jgi:hypothetical protein
MPLTPTRRCALLRSSVDGMARGGVLESRWTPPSVRATCCGRRDPRRLTCLAPHPGPSSSSGRSGLTPLHSPPQHASPRLTAFTQNSHRSCFGEVQVAVLSEGDRALRRQEHACSSEYLNDIRLGILLSLSGRDETSELILADEDSRECGVYRPTQGLSRHDQTKRGEDVDRVREY